MLEDVRGYFRPEFVNRIDEIVVFEPLGRERDRADRRHPAAWRCAAASRTRNLTLDADRRAQAYLADEGTTRRSGPGR